MKSVRCRSEPIRGEHLWDEQASDSRKKPKPLLRLVLLLLLLADWSAAVILPSWAEPLLEEPLLDYCLEILQEDSYCRQIIFASLHGSSAHLLQVALILLLALHLSSGKGKLSSCLSHLRLKRANRQQVCLSWESEEGETLLEMCLNSDDSPPHTTDDMPEPLSRSAENIGIRTENGGKEDSRPHQGLHIESQEGNLDG